MFPVSARLPDCRLFLQDPHIIDEVTDNHQDMDSLNRNVPEPGRQTHQVLQVRQNIAAHWWFTLANIPFSLIWVCTVFKAATLSTRLTVCFVCIYKKKNINQFVKCHLKPMHA